MKHIQWQKGGEADVDGLKEDNILLTSTVPSPPGSRIDGTFLGSFAIRVKIHGSKVQQDGSYALHGRLLDFSRQLRDQILKTVAERSSSSG